MISETAAPVGVTSTGTHQVIAFTAMASPCEILIRCGASEAADLASLACAETRRIETKYSRYLPDNIIHTINRSEGKWVTVDSETRQLLEYAGHCHKLSGGLFDVTSGILRRAWRFEGKEITPDRDYIASLLELVGWDKITLRDDSIRLLPGTEIDLGGFGKEYAVDRVAQMLHERSGRSLVVNFGGDLWVISANGDRAAWDIGIENPSLAGSAIGNLQISDGALATSGLTYRHCMVNGKRLGHILDPRTGWPVADPPLSVTVLGDFCLEAGLLSTLAMLHGAGAEAFLEAQGAAYHCIR